MRKSNQRITKIKDDLILKLLEQAEAMNIEDAVVVQPAGSQLLERPVKGHYRQYVRNNFLKGINGILQIGEYPIINANDSIVNTQNQTFTAILDGLVFITRRYKYCDDLSIDYASDIRYLVGKPLLSFPNLTLRNIHACIDTSTTYGNSMFQVHTAGFVPYTFAHNVAMEPWSFYQIGYNSTTSAVNNNNLDGDQDVQGGITYGYTNNTCGACAPLYYPYYTIFRGSHHFNTLSTLNNGYTTWDLKNAGRSVLNCIITYSSYPGYLQLLGSKYFPTCAIDDDTYYNLTPVRYSVCYCNGCIPCGDESRPCPTYSYINYYNLLYQDLEWPFVGRTNVYQGCSSTALVDYRTRTVFRTLEA